MEEKKEVLMPKQNDYVMATKYTDGDPGDAFGVGFYSGYNPVLKRHYVCDEKGNSLKGNGYRRCEVVSKEFGQYIIDNANKLEQRAISGETINLWDLKANFTTAESS